MSAKNPHISDPALRLLSALLGHGGFCTAALAASFLSLPVPAARKVIGELFGLGYIRKVFLLRARDASNCYQITRRASRMLSHPAPNCARSDPSDAQILRGLVRFWFAFCHVPQGIKDGEALLTEALALAFLLGNGMTVPPRWPVGDDYIETPCGLHIYFAFGPNQSLAAALKQTFLRYSDDLDKVKIGFIIDRNRLPELLKILEEITGESIEVEAEIGQIPDAINAEIAGLQARFATAGAIEKAGIQSQICKLEAQKSAPVVKKSASAGGLSGLILPVVVHDFY